VKKIGIDHLFFEALYEFTWFSQLESEYYFESKSKITF